MYRVECYLEDWKWRISESGLSGRQALLWLRSLSEQNPTPLRIVHEASGEVIAYGQLREPDTQPGKLIVTRHIDHTSLHADMATAREHAAKLCREEGVPFVISRFIPLIEVRHETVTTHEFPERRL